MYPPKLVRNPDAMYGHLPLREPVVSRYLGVSELIPGIQWQRGKPLVLLEKP